MYYSDYKYLKKLFNSSFYIYRKESERKNIFSVELINTFSFSKIKNKKYYNFIEQNRDILLIILEKQFTNDLEIVKKINSKIQIWFSISVIIHILLFYWIGRESFTINSWTIILLFFWIFLIFKVIEKIISKNLYYKASDNILWNEECINLYLATFGVVEPDFFNDLINHCDEDRIEDVKQKKSYIEKSLK